MTIQPAADLMMLAELAIAAGAEILDVAATGFSVILKDDASPVTVADRRAEKIILAGLARLYPDIPVVAEEESAAGRVPLTGERFFLVDPLDGTKEFISRNGEYTVNIGLVVAGEPVAGVVHAPASGALYVGRKGEGAFRADVADGRTGPFARIAARVVPEKRLVAALSRSHNTAGTEAFLASLDIGERIAAGSSMKFCLVADGRADVYPRFGGRTYEWDLAAGDAVLRAAGGMVVDGEGRPFAYGKRGRPEVPDFANGDYVAWGRR